MPYRDLAKRKENARYWNEKRREQDKVRLAAAYSRDPEKVKARSQAWRKANPERLKDQLKAYRRNNYELFMLVSARRRAKDLKLPFSLVVDDIVIPDRCPVLGLELCPGDGQRTDCSPSLDRFEPAKGYVPGNVRVISWRANNLKRNGTAAEFEALARYMRGEI